MDPIKQLLEKLAGICTEDDIKALQESIDTLIEDATEKAIDAQMDAQMEELAESAFEKIRSIKSELTESHAKEAAEYVKTIRESDAKEAAAYIKNLTEAQSIEVAEFVKQRETEITEALEEKMISIIDKTIDDIINEHFTDELAETIAINETYRPIVEGMQQLLASKHLEVDSEGYQTIKESKDIISNQESQIKSLKEQIGKLTSIVESVKTDAEIAKTEKAILEKCEGLSASQKKLVMTLAESVDTSVIMNKIDTIIESVLKTENTIIESEETEEDVINESVVDDTIELGRKIVDTEKAMRKQMFKQVNRLIG